MLIHVPESQGHLYDRIVYPAGELQIRLRKEAIERLFKTPRLTVVCRQAHLYLMELALLSDALWAISGFVDSTLVLPYLPYGRADRRFCEGDCHGLKVFGEMLNGLRFHRIRTLDVHSFRAQKYVPNLVDISARGLIAKAFASISDMGHHPAILLPDEGAKRYAFDGAVECHKRRDEATGKLSGFEVPRFEQDSALIVDDICDGGGTFIGLAKEINKWDEGASAVAYSTHTPYPKAKKLYLYVTHGIFSKGLGQLLKHFEKIYTTDSLYSRALGDPKVEVYDCEALLVD